MADTAIPYAGTAPPGFDATQTVIVNASGASTQAATFLIPTIQATASQNGVWLVSVQALVPDLNNMATGLAVVQYMRGANNLVATGLLVSSAFSGGARGVNSLTIGAPNTSGQVTVTVGWTDATSQAVTFNVTFWRLVAF